MRNTFRYSGLVVAFSALALGACASADEVNDGAEAVEQSSDAIQGGSADKDHPAVGVVYSGGYCSGTLITPTVVLTAGHCVGSVTGFYLGAGKPKQTQLDLSSFKKYEVKDKKGVIISPVNTNDIALVQLTKAVTDVKPITAYGDSAKVGAECTMVGFGRHNEGDTIYKGERRVAFANVTKITSTYDTVKWKDGIADHGDSGGPLICNDVIAATTHNHTDGDYPDHVVENYGRITSEIAKKIDAQIKAWEADAE